MSASGSAIGPFREHAPAKVNLILQVGDRRPDGLHELCSLFASIELADEVVVRRTPTGRDRVSTPGVGGEDLCRRALSAYRDAVPADALPPVEVEVHKRVPIAAGVGGGSADAAATLRALDAMTGGLLGEEGLRRLAPELGADVPSQLVPGHALVTGAGEVVEPVVLPPMDLVLVLQERGLSTAEVYAEADRIGATRARLDPERVRASAALAPERLARAVENDLQAAALSLRPELHEPLAALERAGALAAFVTGSGPTVVGVFGDRDSACSATTGIPGAIVTAVVR